MAASMANLFALKNCLQKWSFRHVPWLITFKEVTGHYKHSIGHAVARRIFLPNPKLNRFASAGHNLGFQVQQQQESHNSFNSSSNNSPLNFCLWPKANNVEQNAAINCSNLNNQKRNYSNESDGDEDGKDGKRKRHPMKLMDFTEVLWPSPFKSLRNRFFALLIRGYFDETFSLNNFLDGAAQAIEFVSGSLSRGNFDNLDGLVSYEALQEIQNNYADLDGEQKQSLTVLAKDVFFKFVYEIGMIFDDDTNQRFVEITVVFQGYPGYDDARTKPTTQYYEELSANQDTIYVCNYRFIREFTKGVEATDWTINKLNHYRPRELPVRW